MVSEAKLVLWLEEIFNVPQAAGGAGTVPPRHPKDGETQSVVDRYGLPHLCREIPHGREFDLVTFFYECVVDNNIAFTEFQVVKLLAMKRPLPPAVETSFLNG